MTQALRYLFVMWDGGGTVAPELSLVRRLVARGHHVRVLADPTLEAEVRAAGSELTPWTTAPHRTSRERQHDLFRDYEIKNPIAMIRGYMQEFLAGPAPRWAADARRAMQEYRPDVAVVDFAIPGALIAAESLGVPSALVMPNIWLIPTRGIPPLGPGFLPARGPLGQLRDRLLRWLTERAFAGALPALNAVRASYGLNPMTQIYDQLLRAERVLLQTTPAFDLTSPHLPAHVRYVGPVLDDPAWCDS